MAVAIRANILGLLDINGTVLGSPLFLMVLPLKGGWSFSHSLYKANETRDVKTHLIIL